MLMFRGSRACDGIFSCQPSCLPPHSSWTLLQSLPISFRMTYEEANPYKKSDLVFYMDLPPHTSYERILARIEAESRMSEAEGKKVDRRKFHHMHETPETLAFLQEQFEDVIPYARDELGL